jgi:hypothetical protein
MLARRNRRALERDLSMVWVTTKLQQNVQLQDILKTLTSKTP